MPYLLSPSRCYAKRKVCRYSCACSVVEYARVAIYGGFLMCEVAAVGSYTAEFGGGCFGHPCWARAREYRHTNFEGPDDALYGMSESGWIHSELFLAWMMIFLEYSKSYHNVLLFYRIILFSWHGLIMSNVMCVLCPSMNSILLVSSHNLCTPATGCSCV